MNPSDLIPKFRELMALELGYSEPSNHELFKILKECIPLEVHRFPSGTSYNGWEVPRAWKVNHATISENGQIVFDATSNRLAVQGYALPFQGTVSKEELSEHVYCGKEYADKNSTPYHPGAYYRPWKRTWGFCMPQSAWSTLGDGPFEVDLQTTEEPGEMLVGEITHQGSTSDTVYFGAHTCHPHQFEDGLAGIYAIVSLFQWLRTQDTKLTYKALFGPEIFGTAFFLSKLSSEALEKIKGAVFTEMIGIDKGFALQKSIDDHSWVNRAMEMALSSAGTLERIGEFREILGNDEIAWEAPGIEVPCVSVTRCSESPFLYSEYHTDFDTLERSDFKKIAETAEAFKLFVEICERNRVYERSHRGLICLSNPEYDLFIDRTDQASAVANRLPMLQEKVTRYLDGKRSVLDIASELQVDFFQLSDLLEAYLAKGLIQLSQS